MMFLVKDTATSIRRVRDASSYEIEPDVRKAVETHRQRDIELYRCARRSFGVRRLAGAFSPPQSFEAGGPREADRSAPVIASGTIRCQFIIIASLGQFGVSSSLLLPLGQFGVSSSLLLPLHQVGKLDSDNSVSVHHYCFPCIKSVSWIQTIRCQFIIIASLASSR